MRRLAPKCRQWTPGTANDPKALYLIVLVIFGLLISVTGAFIFKRATHQGLVWACDLKDGKPIASVDVTLEPWRFGNALWEEETNPQRCKVYLHTNRPLYRPGQKVRFRAIIRCNEGYDGVRHRPIYSPPPLGTPVRMQVIHPSGEFAIYDKTPRTNPFGSVKGVAPLDEGLMPGLYHIKVEVAGEKHDFPLEVRARWDWEYALDLETDQESYVNGQVITATIHASYPLGAPVVGLPVRYVLRPTDGCLRLGEAGLDFQATAQPPSRRPGQELVSGEGITDENGRLEVALPADLRQGGCSQILILEAKALDPGKTSSEAAPAAKASLAIPVYEDWLHINLQPERYVARAGQEAAFIVQVVDVWGRSPGQVPLRYHLDQIEWWKGQEVITEALSAEMNTDRNGRGHISFVPRQGGLYRLRVEGGNDRATSHLWVGEADDAVGWPLRDDHHLQLVTDKMSYQPGETAQILVQSPYERATALVTVERERIMDWQVVELARNSAILTLPVAEAYFPNVFVCVVLMPQGVPSDTLPSFKMGYAELTVEPADRQMIFIIPEKRRYRSGEKALCSIRTMDLRGQPVVGEVSLAVIDALSHILSDKGTQDIVRAFHDRLTLKVRTTQSLAVGTRGLELSGGEERASTAIASTQMDGVSSDAVYWNPSVVTDESGRATLEFELPRELRTWRVVAQGVTADTTVGSAYADLVVDQELTVQPALPRFLRAGDKAHLEAMIHNRTDRTMEVDTALSAVGLELSGEPTHTVVIPAGQVIRVTWPVIASQTSLEKTKISISSEVTTDQVSLSMPILPFSEEKVVADSGWVRGERALTVSLPKDAAAAELTLDVCSPLAACLIEGVEHLRDYPHSSVEGITSYLLSAVLVNRALEGSGLDDGPWARSWPCQVKKGLACLYRLQNDDGGWGWWEDEDSQFYATAYVVHTLDEVQRAGFAVADDVLQRGLRALRGSDKADDPNLQAYTLYLLTERGEGDMALAHSLMDRGAEMDLWARAYLAMALNTLGSSAEAQAIMADLARQVIASANLARWQEKEEGGEGMSSDGRSTALILQAMLQVDSGNPLISKVVHWLMRTREGSHWHTTQETAAAITALSAYLAAGDQMATGHAYQVYVNGQLIGEETVTPGKTEGRRRFAINDLTTGDNEVRLVVRGEGEIYYAASLRYHLTRARLEPARSLGGPIVLRRYLDADSGESPKEHKVGDLIDVELTIKAPEEMWYVLVEDPLPAGCEAVGGSLEAVSPRESSSHHWLRTGSGSDRASFLITHLEEGEHIYTYRIRAATAGRFRAPPAEVRPLYAPGVWGRSASAAIIINRR